MSAYEHDLYAWTQTQGAALRRRAANEIDWDNLAEEIETSGRSDRREIRSRLEVLLIHLLKWRFQPELRCGSRQASIEEARHRIAILIADSPSLAGYPAECLPAAYPYARARALRETGALNLPDACPWTAALVLDDGWAPD